MALNSVPGATAPVLARIFLARAVASNSTGRVTSWKSMMTPMQRVMMVMASLAGIRPPARPSMGIHMAAWEAMLVMPTAAMRHWRGA